MAETDEFRIAPIVLTGIVSAILLFVLTVAMSALLLHAKATELQKKSTTAKPELLQRNTNREMALLHDYRWIDEKKGVVRIPIERAMELMVEEAARDD
ncbi:MAG: hypothetical protein ACYTDY_19310 [Planctomycetota bacterium]|jgi:hypothetical protein